MSLVEATTRTSVRFGWKNWHIDDVAREREASLDIAREASHGMYSGELTLPEHPDHPVILYAPLSNAAGIERIAVLYRADHLEDR